ncbi:cation efflux family-domain-containing protein [Xylaria bambusicola]|uniref:cation efflux family-domain-containing protein n=1 Tax=Xylaria bambusicola TaxID=326684 RepID=UPI0020089A57|nr:cation efflux family-domain-containing protein [Xylaria bambusicola]KAI0512656.1 cation efflux family-domain-containing protein [Xylaria bambusicola]
MLAQCRPSFGRLHHCFAAGQGRSRWLTSRSTLPRDTTTTTTTTIPVTTFTRLPHHKGRPNHQGSGLRTHCPHLPVQSRRVLRTSCIPSPAIPSATSSPLSPSLPPSPIHVYSRSLLGSLPAMTSITQTRTHSGHNHGHGGHHHHHHDNVYLTSQNKNDAGVRITRIGLYSNLGMAIAKGVGGYAFNSQAMVADAVHSATDLASDILTLATLSWSLKPPTDRFPTGFGKIESLGSLGVSGMLLFGGLWMGYSSLLTLYGQFFLDPAAAAELASHAHGHSHSHSHDHGAALPSLHAAWLAAGTVAIKEWLFHATMKVSRERKSSVLASNAVHHRIDSLTGIVTLAVILGANVFTNAAWLDPVGGLMISLMVVKAGAANTLDALFELADRSIDDEVKSSVRKQAQKAMIDISEGHQIELRDVSGIKSGQNYLVDLEVAVPGSWTIEGLKKAEDIIRTRVGGKVRGVRKVRVRFVSKEATVTPKFDEFIPGDVSPRSSPEPDAEDDHNNNNNNNNTIHEKSK